MLTDKEDAIDSGRRRFVMGGVASVVGLGIAGTGLGSATKEVGTPNENLTLLGDFEESRDGWRTNGGNRLNRITNEEFNGAVTRGSHALAVTTDGDNHPMIENAENIEHGDFLDSPYLLTDVSSVIKDHDGAVVFQYRYHYDHSRSNGSETNGRKKREKSVRVEESPAVRVPQFSQSTICWDMSEIADAKLENPSRLQLIWYAADHPPEGGARGRNGSSSSFEYQGLTFIDNIRLSDDPTAIGRRGVDDTFSRSRRQHGPIDTVERERISETEVRGEYIFDDGAGVTFQFETKSEGKYVFTLDGQSFKLGGGWT